MFNLTSLPYEIISTIVLQLSLDDVFELAQTCRALGYLLREERICKSIVQVDAQDLSASKIAGKYSRILRRYTKRQHALRTAQPFSVAIVGFCDTFTYNKGILCYQLDDQLRLLNLSRSSSYEVVVSISGLLARALRHTHDLHRGDFKVLYCADNIVSCLYETFDSNQMSWLISFNARYCKLICVRQLQSTTKIFVRHNKNYIYYGTHSDIGADGYWKWVISGFDVETRQWFDQDLSLPNLVGSEIGSNICFELHDGFFYALSNQTSFEVEEIDWSSFYYVVRFPLAFPRKELVQTTENTEQTWRRQHQEGPIDDRWTNLRLEVDDMTNKLQIVESRREWHLGASRSQRTYYTTPISFPALSPDALLNEVPELQHDSQESDVSYSPSGPEDWAVPSSSSDTQGKRVPQTRHNLELLPEDPLKHLLEDTDNPQYIEPPLRLPEFVHHGNDGSTTQTFTLARSLVRRYYRSCSTFVDLVDDPLPNAWPQKQRLRLRVGGRRLGPLLRGEDGLLVPQSEVKDLSLNIALKTIYKEEGIKFFPDYQDPRYSENDLEAITNLLNPSTHLGNIEGIADEYGMVYVTGGSSKEPKALVWLGFDPGVKLEGLKWPERKPFAFKTGNGLVKTANETENLVVTDRKGKAKAGDISESAYTQREGEVTARAQANNNSKSTKPKSWAWRERAMYSDIQLGYYLGMPTSTLAYHAQ